jgi:hypothetical protein
MMDEAQWEKRQLAKIQQQPVQISVSAEELKARTMIETYRVAHEWTQHRQIALIVWRACWSGALPIERINEIGKALANLNDLPDLQETVTEMARAKLLRSYRKQGRKFYEVNF